MDNPINPNFINTVLVLLLVALWFYEAICCMSFRMSFCSCVFRSFWCCDYLAWGREGWSWCFSYVCSVCACLDLSVSSSSWGLGGGGVGGGELRFVIVALPGLFSDFFFYYIKVGFNGAKII